MSDKPLVSILIPCYNHENFLDDCLSSILAQTYDNIELLICDDCSPDRSFEKITDYEQRLKKRFSRVVIMRNDVNQGVTKNINRMLKLAQGVFVKTIASDDAMAPTAIAQMTQYLIAHPQIDVVVSNGIKVSESEQYPNFTPIEKIYSAAPDFRSDGFFARVAACNPISAPAAMVRMSVYDKYGYYDEQVKVEDYEFWLRILKDGCVQFGFLDENLLYYRLNANSMTSLTGNAGLARRRKLIHESEMDTLAKYRDCLAPSDYAIIATQRMMSERWLAVEYQLIDWEKELADRWHKFSDKKYLPLKNRISVRLFYLRQWLKQCIYRSRD
jgi:alpha-1,3-rhamnosyltransferase